MASLCSPKKGYSSYLLTTRTFAPHSINLYRMDRWPYRAATRSGVFPELSATSIFSELIFTKVCITSVWRPFAAQRRDVFPILLTTRTFAPYSINFYRMDRWPYRAATRSGVSPSLSATSIFSELLFNKVCTTSVWPPYAAQRRAILPIC